jgi:hypothetical protein
VNQRGDFFELTIDKQSNEEGNPNFDKLSHITTAKNTLPRFVRKLAKKKVFFLKKKLKEK